MLRNAEILVDLLDKEVKSLNKKGNVVVGESYGGGVFIIKETKQN